MNNLQFDGAKLSYGVIIPMCSYISSEIILVFCLILVYFLSPSSDHEKDSALFITVSRASHMVNCNKYLMNKGPSL